MGAMCETGCSITPDRAERRGWACRKHRRPAAHQSSTALDHRIGMVEMEERSRWLRRRLGDVVGVTAHDLRTHRTVMRGLLDSVPWPEGLLEQLPAQAAHTLSLQPEAFFLMKWSTLRTVERHL